jgi:hypothetical protein
MDLLVLTSSIQLLIILKIILFLFTKIPILIRRSTVLSLPLQLGFSGLMLASKAGAYPGEEPCRCSTLG